MDDGVKKSFIKYNYELFAHHLYELDKGLRHLVLHTAPIEVVDDMIRKLKKNDVPFHIQELSCGKINLFFGERECVETIKKFKNKALNKYTPEEDFILGILLGYDPLKQTKRYLKFKNEGLSIEKCEKDEINIY